MAESTVKENRTLGGTVSGTGWNDAADGRAGTFFGTVFFTLSQRNRTLEVMQ